MNIVCTWARNQSFLAFRNVSLSQMFCWHLCPNDSYNCQMMVVPTTSKWDLTTSKWDLTTLKWGLRNLSVRSATLFNESQTYIEQNSTQDWKWLNHPFIKSKCSLMKYLTNCNPSWRWMERIWSLVWVFSWMWRRNSEQDEDVQQPCTQKRWCRLSGTIVWN